MQPPQKTFSICLEKIIAWIGYKTRFFQPSFIRYGPQYPPRPIKKAMQPSNAPLPAQPPSISIVIPSFNQASYLEKTITSLLDQQYPFLEVIIVDGGSTDGSVEIIKDYSDKITWWCSETDTGQTNALNKGFRHSSGEIMAWLNADDCLMPASLNRIANFMVHNPDADAAYAQRILIDENDQEVGRWILPPHNDKVLTWADFIPQETLFWRRSLWEKIGGRLDESFHFAMDWDLLLRFRETKAKMVRLPYFIGLFRIHSSQKTSAQIDEVGFAEMQRLRARTLHYPPLQYRVAFGTAGYLLKARAIELFWKTGVICYD